MFKENRLILLSNFRFALDNISLAKSSRPGLGSTESNVASMRSTLDQSKPLGILVYPSIQPILEIKLFQNSKDVHVSYNGKESVFKPGQHVPLYRALQTIIIDAADAGNPIRGMVPLTG